MKNKILNKKLTEGLKEKQWDNFLSQTINNPLLEKASQLPEYFRNYGSAQLVAVIPALEHSHEKAQSYYSASSLNDSLRLAPAFLFDNTSLINIHQDKIFELTDEKIPHYMSKGFTDNNMHLFIFDTEASKLHSYQKGTYSKSVFFEDMKKHIMKNPVAVIFKGSDDGNVGMRFSSQLEAQTFLKSLNVFEDVFNHSDDMQKTLIKMKKENPIEDLSSLFKGNLEYHN